MLIAVATACGPSPPAPVDAARDAVNERAETGPPAVWPCPPGWLPAARGGCGPAVLLCEPDGGAADPSACPPPAVPPALDADAPTDAALAPDGAPLVAIARTADGRWAGAWPWSEHAVRAGIPTCPDGWRRDEDGACDPALSTACPAGSHALPGGATAPDRACTATAERDCPSTGEYPDTPDRPATAPTVYVRAGADPAAARGTPELPYATLGAALAASPSGRWVLVAAGTYNESITVRDAATIVGVCAARVTLVAPATPRLPTVYANAGTSRVTLRGVTVSGPYFGVVAEARAQLTLTAARVVRATGLGVLSTTGAQVRLRDVLVQDTLVLPLTRAGVGVFVDGGATLDATRVAVVDSRGSGIFARGVGTRVAVHHSVVRGTTPSVAGRAGIGIEVSLAATLTADHAVVADTQGYGVLASSPRETPNNATLESSVVRDTAPVAGALPELGTGQCVRAEQGGRLTLVGVTVERCRGAAVSAIDDAQASVHDSVVRDARRVDTGAQGVGLYAQTGATLVADGVRLIENGFGLAANERGTLRARHVVALGHGVGAVSFRAGTTLALSDAVVRGLDPGTEAARGAFGLEALSGSTLTAERVRVTDSSQVGALASGGGRLVVTEVLIEHVASTPTGTFGRGVTVQQAGALVATHAVVADVREMAFAVHGAEATAALTDVVAADVARSQRGFGVGVGAFGGAAVTLARVAVTRVAGAAVCLAAETGAPDEAPASATGEHVFVRGVAESTIRFDASGSTGTPVGREVSYALYSGARGALDLTHVAAQQAGFGFVANGARLALRDGAVSGMTGAFGVANGVQPGWLVLERVDRRDNARDEVLRDLELPEASTLPLPAALCPESPCE